MFCLVVRGYELAVSNCEILFFYCWDVQVPGHVHAVFLLDVYIYLYPSNEVSLLHMIFIRPQKLKKNCSYIGITSSSASSSAPSEDRCMVSG